MQENLKHISLFEFSLRTEGTNMKFCFEIEQRFLETVLFVMLIIEFLKVFLEDKWGITLQLRSDLQTSFAHE